MEGWLFIYRFFQQGVHSIDIPDTDCVGNADAMRQAHGYTFCVYPTSHSMMSEMPIPSMKQKLTVMQIAEFFRKGVSAKHLLGDHQMLYPLPEDSILVIVAGVLVL